MNTAIDYLGAIQGKPLKVNPGVKIKKVNQEFVDAIARAKQTDRSSVIDQILDAARTQYEAAIASNGAHA